MIIETRIAFGQVILNRPNNKVFTNEIARKHAAIISQHALLLSDRDFIANVFVVCKGRGVGCVKLSVQLFGLFLYDFFSKLP